MLVNNSLKKSNLEDNPLQCVAGILFKDNKVLIAERPLNKPHGGFWEFPGGKVEPGESLIEALARELLEEIDVIIDKDKALFLTTLHNIYPKGAVDIHVYRIDLWEKDPKPLEQQFIQYVSCNDLALIPEYPDKPMDGNSIGISKFLCFLPGLKRILPYLNF